MHTPKVFCLILFLSGHSVVAYGQQAPQKKYSTAFDLIASVLADSVPTPLKDVVFEVENAYLDDALDHDVYNERILGYAAITEAWFNANHLNDNHAPDSVQFAKSGALFHLITDTVFAEGRVPISLPFTYDTTDFFGLHDWTKMFVTKLLATHSGNCHSMPLFYKILAEELGVKAYLAVAPNHLYLKQHSEKIGWYNTELTSAAFPTDAWLMASGYVSSDALRSGIYMDTLSDKQTLSLCLIDLAEGFQDKYPQDNEEFILKCCAMALEYYPVCVAALQLKAEAIGRLRERTVDEAMKAAYLDELNSTLSRLVDLGYREVPLEVFQLWFAELRNHPEKFANPRMEQQHIVIGGR